MMKELPLVCRKLSCLGQMHFNLAGLKTRVEDGMRDMADMMKYKDNTFRDLLDLSMSFDNLAASYTTNFTTIKQKLAIVLECMGRGAGSSRQSRVRWDNQNLESSQLNLATEDQLTGMWS
jgi:hypothetical protein